MDAGQVVPILAVVVPIITAVIADGIATRTRLAVVEERQKSMRHDFDELERRQARHERDPAHARLRPEW